MQQNRADPADDWPNDQRNYIFSYDVSIYLQIDYNSRN